jgi:hypothetical protein
MEPNTPRGLMTLATMAYALSVVLVGLMSWRVLGPWWGAIACIAVAVIAGAGAVAMWRLPSWWVDTTVVLALVSTVALGASIPATVRGILAVGDGTMTEPTMMVTLVLVGIASTIYLAFAGTSLLEDRRVRTEEAGGRVPRGVGEPGGYAIAGR